MRALLFFIILFGYSTEAFAIVPEEGLWWNPAESGRGYGIEIQDNKIFVTYYAYSQNGSSAFYTSGGDYIPSTNTASAYFVALSNGQCFGCAYTGRPTVTNLGNATFTFFSRMTGRIDLPNGVSIPIQRQFFFDAQPRTNMYGTWHLTTGALGLYFGDFLWIQAPNASIEGGFQGRVVDGSAQRILVGSPQADGTIGMLVDSSTSYYTLYRFEWSINKWLGRSWTYLKTSQPSGGGLLFVGSRFLGKTYAEQAATLGAGETQHLDVLDDEALESIFSARMSVEKVGVSPSKSVLTQDAEDVDIELVRDIARSLASRLSSVESR